MVLRSRINFDALFAILSDKGGRLRVASLRDESLLCLLLYVLMRALRQVDRRHGMALRLLHRLLVSAALQNLLLDLLGLLK